MTEMTLAPQKADDQSALAVGFRPCGLVPTYNNPDTVRSVVERVREHIQDVIVVDDGSNAETRKVCEAIAAEGLAIVHHRAKNGGKGAAVKSGFVVALANGFTHVMQVDADGQHDLTEIPTFLAAAADAPDTLVLGYPVYDDSAPKNRLAARKFTKFWVDLEAGKGRIGDAMVGFRVYPVAAAIAANARGNWMDFDIEIAVRMAWTRMPILNLPVAVRYHTAEEGGVSHFRPFADNLRFSWLHSRLCTRACFNWFGRTVTFWKKR